MSKKTSVQLTLCDQFNVRNVIFEAPQKRMANDNGKEVPYYNISIKIRYPDGSEGPLIIELPQCFTWGVGDKYGSTWDKLSLSLTLGEKEITEEHRVAINVINDIVAAAKKYLLNDEIKIKIGQYDLEESQLKKITPLKVPVDKDPSSKNFGKPMTDKPPSLPLKFKTGKNKDTKELELVSGFWLEGEFHPDGSRVAANPLDFVAKQAYITPLVSFENIYVGNSIKVQTKLYECEIKEKDFGFKSLLRSAAAPARPTTPAVVATPAAMTSLSGYREEIEDEEEEEQATEEVERPAIKDDEEVMETEEAENEEEPEPPKVEVKAPTTPVQPAAKRRGPLAGKK
jgi:hypothetical protein